MSPTYTGANRGPRAGQPPAQPRPASSSRVARTKDRPFTVLIVDDAEDIRQMYASYFRFAGVRVLLARDGVEAVHAATFYQPDAIVMDLAMPRMTGWEAIGQLKREAHTRRIPIVSLTGHVYEDSRTEAIKAGADLFVTKPCRPDILLSLLLQLMRGDAPSGGSAGPGPQRRM